MMNSATICGHCKRYEHCRMFLKDTHAVVMECGRYEETDLHKSIRDGFTEIIHKKKIKVINAGNCMMCGREIKIATNKENYKLPNVLFCPRCEKNRMRELNKHKEELENQLNMSVQKVIEEDKHDKTADT